MIFSCEFEGYLTEVDWRLNWKLGFVAELLFGLPIYSPAFSDLLCAQEGLSQ